MHAGCWSHAERCFAEAEQLNPPRRGGDRDRRANRRAVCHRWGGRRQTLSLEARDILRQEQIATAAGVIRQQIEAARSTALPGGERAKASNYTLTLWDRLTRFLEHPALELSNNLAENSMRPVALGRKNWIHIGSAQAGPKIAAIRSVVESCRRLKLPARAERTSSAISKPCTCA